jgi:GT2 family glycosyltransferase
MHGINVCVIIVTYNNEKVIELCLKALFNQTLQKFDIVLVDNNSRDATIGIANKYSRIQIISLKENRGFAGGNIEGLKHTDAEYIALLNPDTEPAPNWLEALVKAASSESQVGICASKLIVHNTEFIDSAGDGCTTTGKGFKRGEGENLQKYSTSEHVFGACGGAMLIKRALVDEIGFLDADFFLIHEDTDLNFRAQLAGWRCLYVPEALVSHKVRSSIGQMSDLAVYYSVRNAAYVVIKNLPFWLLVRYLHHHIIGEIVSFIYFVFINQKIKPYFKAKLDVIRNLPVLLKKRQQVKVIKKVTNKELDQLLTSIWESQFFRHKINKLLSK